MQQMIISAFFALGLQGKGTQLPSFLFVDSGVSNHMTGSLMGLHDVRKYEGDQDIQIIDGSTLPITAIGTLGPSFHDVFVSPDLFTTLVSIGQLVDYNCDVHFSHGGCVM